MQFFIEILFLITENTVVDFTYDIRQHRDGQTSIHCRRTNVQTSNFSSDIKYENVATAITYSVNHIVNTNWATITPAFVPIFKKMANDFLLSFLPPIFNERSIRKFCTR